jgi:transposase
MPETVKAAVAVIGIDIGKNSLHVVGLNQRGAIVLRQRWSRGQVETRFANMPPCLIGMEACVGAHHLSRRLKALGHDARLMPAKYVRILAAPSDVVAPRMVRIIEDLVGDWRRLDERRSTAALVGSEELVDASVEEFAIPLHLRALRECKRVLDVNAEVADGALDLRMPE